MSSPETRHIAAAAAGSAGAAAAFLAWAVRGRSARVFGPSVWRGPCGPRALALTFDDGPSEGTPELLDELARHNVAATFFQCGVNVNRLPDIARAVREAGHELGNHGYAHALYCFRSRQYIADDMARAQQAISDQTGARPALFRAPFGARWFGLGPAQRRMGLLGVMWSVIGYDWSLPASAVAKRVAAGARNGAIICLHDGRELQRRPNIRATVDAVRLLVPVLLDQGYRFETVSRLLCPTN